MGRIYMSKVYSHTRWVVIYKNAANMTHGMSDLFSVLAWKFIER